MHHCEAVIQTQRKKAHTLEKDGGCLMQKNQNFIHMALSAQTKKCDKQKRKSERFGSSPSSTPMADSSWVFT